MGIEQKEATIKKNQKTIVIDYTIVLHFIFWLLYFGVIMLLSTQTLPIIYALQRNILIVVLNATVFYLNFLWIMPEYFERGDFKSYTLAMMGMLLLAPTIQYFIEFYLFTVPEEIQIFTYNIRYVLWIGITILIFLSLSTLLKLAMSRSFFERELLELRARKYEAELKFLREQINPHFLFNSINNIYSLALENSPKTPEMILKLSELLRYMLYECNQPKVRLEEEIKCVNSLVELFQLKFSEPVNITFQISGNPRDIMIVPNLFTPMIENAFKHGNLTSNKKSFIEIICNIRLGYIYFSVKNSKSPIEEKQQQPGGIGIANLKRRFEINYSPRGLFKVKTTQDYYQAAMKIPL
jgi:sensor histidine kinase YesM